MLTFLVPSGGNLKRWDESRTSNPSSCWGSIDKQALISWSNTIKGVQRFGFYKSCKLQSAATLGLIKAGGQRVCGHTDDIPSQQNKRQTWSRQKMEIFSKRGYLQDCATAKPTRTHPHMRNIFIKTKGQDWNNAAICDATTSMRLIPAGAGKPTSSFISFVNILIHSKCINLTKIWIFPFTSWWRFRCLGPSSSQTEDLLGMGSEPPAPLGVPFSDHEGRLLSRNLEGRCWSWFWFSRRNRRWRRASRRVAGSSLSRFVLQKKASFIEEIFVRLTCWPQDFASPGGEN